MARVNVPFPSHLPQVWFRVYALVAGSAGLALYFLKIRKLPRVNQVLLLVTACVLFPPVSYTYTLIHIYIGWAVVLLYLLDMEEDNREPWAMVLFGLFAVVLSPQDFAHIGLHQFHLILNVLALCGIFYIGLRYPMIEHKRLRALASE